MNRLMKIARQSTPGTGVLFSQDAYGIDGVRRFLDRAWRQVKRNRGAGTDRRLVVARRDNDQGVRTLGSSELGTGKATALGWDVSA